MSRPHKIIPIHDVTVKGLKTLVEEGKTQEQLADYYECDQSTISRKIKAMTEEK